MSKNGGIAEAMSGSSNSGSGSIAVNAISGFEAKDWRAAQPSVALRRARASDSSKWLIRAKPGGFAQECVRARAIMTEARGVVEQAHAVVEAGGRLDVAAMDPVVEAIAASVARDPTAIPSVTRLKLRHEYTFFHSVAVCGLMVGLARAMRLDDGLMHQIGLAGLLHDIGKARIPTQLLNKPGSLTPAEFDLIRQHTVRGHEILRDAGDVPDLVLDVCLNHHERVDGTGYPARKPGAQLSLHARMGAICDVYDAVTSARAYKSAWSPAEALEWMRGATGHFDRAILPTFAKMIGAFPTGSLVRLTGDRLAVVLDAEGADPLDPTVCIFMDGMNRRPVPHQRIERAGAMIVSLEHAERWAISDWTAVRAAILKGSGGRTLRSA